MYTFKGEEDRYIRRCETRYRMETGKPEYVKRRKTRITSGPKMKKRRKKRCQKRGANRSKKKKKDWENPESPLEAAHALASPSIHTNIKSILRKTGA